MSAQFHFGVFAFDQASRELRRDGVLVRLQSQPAQALGCLLERAPDVVSREELCRAVWPDGTFVDFERGLNFCIAQVRAALNDTAVEPRFIRTIPKRGYQFIAPFERAISEDLSPSGTHRAKTAWPSKKRLGFVAACLAVLLSIAAAYWMRG